MNINGLKLILILLISINIVVGYKYKSKKNFEIQEDFIVSFEYALEKTSKNWTERGTIEFKTKNSGKNYDSNAKAITKDFTEEEQKAISEECIKNGLIIVRVKLQQTNLISSIKAVINIYLKKLIILQCELVSTDYKDKIVFNYYGNFKQDSITSFSYESRYALPEIHSKRSKVNNSSTEIEFVETQINLGPASPDEKTTEEKFSAVPPTEEKSFFQKYVRLISY